MYSIKTAHTELVGCEYKEGGITYSNVVTTVSNTYAGGTRLKNMVKVLKNT